MGLHRTTLSARANNMNIYIFKDESSRRFAVDLATYFRYDLF